MQVDTEPFPMNMISFDDKKFLVRPNATDKGKGKEIIIGDPWEDNEITKIYYRKVVAEKTQMEGRHWRSPSWPLTLGADTGGQPRATLCSTHYGLSGAQARMVWDTTGQSRQIWRTIRLYLGPPTTTYLQAMTNRNRYMEDKYI
jgi:hypothetical protein